MVGDEPKILYLEDATTILFKLEAMSRPEVSLEAVNMQTELVKRRGRLDRVLNTMIRRGTFSMNAIKRELQRFVADRRLAEFEEVGLIKANGMVVEEMFYAGEAVFDVCYEL